MPISRNTWHWTALIGLWGLVGLILWLLAVQGFMVLISSTGTWQRPGIARVIVTQVEQDDQSTFTDYVLAKEGGKERVLCMLKADCEDVKVGDEIWILDNYYTTTTRPAQFRLTPWRLLVEYPEPLLFLSLLGIWRVRRSMAKALKNVQVTKRIELKDDFHLRAQRFSAPKESGRNRSAD